MSDPMNLTLELGPQFTIEVVESIDQQLSIGLSEPITQQFTLVAGVKSSSLFAVAGSTATNLTVSITSAMALGLFRAVTFSGIYCEPDIDSLSEYAGVTTVAVGLGETTKVVKSGLITEGSWSWTPNAPIFVGTLGVLTQTPGALPIRRIGWAISATQIILDPFPIIGA